MKKQIRNVNSLKPVPERLFDAIVDNDGNILTEFKLGKNNKVVVPWSDIVYQVENFKKQQIK